MRIARAILAAIRRHLVAAYPEEGCGFLMGARGADGAVVVSHELPITNRRGADGAARNRYLVSPDDFRFAEREATAAGLQIVGVYHSHPDVAARPSSYDQEHAWPWYRYLIVSVVAGAVREEQVWELADDRRGFVEQVLQIEEQ